MRNVVNRPEGTGRVVGRVGRPQRRLGDGGGLVWRPRRRDGGRGGGLGAGRLIRGLGERGDAAEEQKGRPYAESCANREHCLVALLKQAALVGEGAVWCRRGQPYGLRQVQLSLVSG